MALRIAVSGAAGRMGRAIIALVLASDEMEVVAALEAESDQSQGLDAGELAGYGASGLKISSVLDVDCDVMIDFSSPSGAMTRFRECVKKGLPLVIGTTGLDEDQRAEIASDHGSIPVLFAPNMSVGANLLAKLAAEAARALGLDYDVEIIETHHGRKKDAPSGTALKLAGAIAEATGRDLDADAVYGRYGRTGERGRGEIGVHAVRGGDITGDHVVLLAGPGERIELIHRAHTRDTFAAGALRAAAFLVGKKPGVYSMEDVLAAS